MSLKKWQRKDSKRTTTKKCCNSGNFYINIKANLVEGKTFQNVNCDCRLKCTKSVTEDERHQLFDLFYKIGYFVQQNAYINGLVHQASVKQRRPQDASKGEKWGTNLYHIKV